MGNTPRDVDQLTAIYEAEVAWVCRTLRRFGVPEAELEDLAHDVFVVVHRRLADYDRSRPVRPWLFGIAMRVASDRRRRVRPPRSDAEVEEQSAPGRSAEEQVIAGEARDLILEALDAVEVERRAVLILHDIEGVAAPEIAAITGLPQNTVYSRLRLARAGLAAAVRRLRARRGEP